MVTHRSKKGSFCNQGYNNNHLGSIRNAQEPFFLRVYTRTLEKQKG